MSNLTVSIHTFVHDLDALHEQFAAERGISTMGMLVLHELYREDGQKASDLALKVGKAATSFTPLLDRLQEAELICRRPHPKDRRAVQIFLTIQGMALRKDIVGHMDAMETCLRETFSARLKQPMPPGLEPLFAPLPESKPL